MRLLEAFLALASVTAQAQKTFKVSGDVTFTAVGNPGFMRIEGEGGKVSGTLQQTGDMVLGELTVELKDFETGIDLRDEHMREKYLEVGKYPRAKLTLSPVPAKAGQVLFKGALELKGGTKPAEGGCKTNPSAGTWLAECTLKVKLSDYPQIGVPSYLGVTVAEAVDVRIVLKAAP
jgi:polyisoprenoid-binding protein YceI